MSLMSKRDRERLAASASHVAVNAACQWLTVRLDEDRQAATDYRHAILLESAIKLVGLHGATETANWHRETGDSFWSKCASESWECYGDGRINVQAPCESLKLLAAPYVHHHDFPEILR